MTVTTRVAAAAVVCGALLSDAVHSQAPYTARPVAQDTPTFRSAVDAVAFEVFVTDAAGKPVTGLSVEDFELLENGKSQPITTFYETVIPIEPGSGKAETWPVPRDTGTNHVADSRIYIFALDESIVDANILRTRRFLRQFLERFFNDNDLAAVVNVGRALATDGQTFTSDRALLLKAVDKFSGGFEPRRTMPQYAPPGMDLRSNTVDVQTKDRLSGLRDLTESLAKIPGRKTVLYFTSGIGFDLFTSMDYRGGVMMLAAEYAHGLASVATRANVVFYPIDPGGLGGGSLENKMDMRALASVTGGFALVDSNSFMQTFQRVQQESSAYYMLGFNSGYTNRDGRMVRVAVRVKRPGLQVKSREGYLAAVGVRPSRDRVGDTSPALEAMASPVLMRGVSMQVFAAPFRGASGRDAAVALVVDIDPATLDLTDQDGRRTGNIEVTYSAVDTRKRAYLGGRHTFAVSLMAADYADARVNGLRMVSTLALPKGAFELRVGAASGPLTGSVVHHIDIPDFSEGRLTMSGLALTTTTVPRETTLTPPRSTGGASKTVKCEPPSCIVPLSRETPSADEPLRALATPPVARRTFARDEELVVFAELYENGRQPAHRLRFDVTLEGTDRVILPFASETRTVAEGNGNARTEAFTVQASLRDVPVGRYVLRAHAHSDGRRDAAAGRAIPIEVR